MSLRHRFVHPRNVSKLTIAPPPDLASFRPRTDHYRRSPLLRLKSLASILFAMIIPPSPRPVSVKSLAGSPIRKPQDFSEDVEEELRSINNDFPPIDFDFEFNPVQSVPPTAPPSVCDPDAHQHLFATSSETCSSHGAKHPSSAFSSLPSEIHDKILDHLLGPKVSMSSPSATVDSSPKSWAKAPRFPRRKKVTDLTLVCPSWRNLIQSRLYRHSRLNGDHISLSHDSRY